MKRNYYLRGNRWSRGVGIKKRGVCLVTNLPLVSVFLIKENGVVSRGVALCSDKDNPDKYIGRWLAHINAIEARDSKKSSKRIKRSEAINVLNKVVFGYQETKLTSGYRAVYSIAYRAEYDPVLTAHEIELMYV